MLSSRAEEWVNATNGLMLGMKLASQNPFDLDKTPDGCINLGAAENELMYDMLASRVQQLYADFKLDRQDIRYQDFLGTHSTRSAISTFLNDILSIKTEADQVSVHNGCGSAVESLFHVLCDVGDAILCPTPYYGGFDFDVVTRAKVEIVPVDLYSRNQFKLTAEAVESAYQKALKANKRVRALLIMNPVNPLGCIYDRETIQLLIEFCHQHRIHLVCDEIYALSIFDSATRSQFASIYTHSLPDPERVHLLWGFSKDFCVNGFRVGVCVTRNKRVRDGLNQLAYFTGVPTLMQHVITGFVTDSSFYHQFIETNHKRLLDSYTLVTKRIEKFNRDFGQKHAISTSSPAPIQYLPATSGFFLWTDFSFFYRLPGMATNPSMTTAAATEMTLFLRFIEEGKVYIAPGSLAFHARDQGWFRIVFAAREKVLNVALDRMFGVLEKWYVEFK